MSYSTQFLKYAFAPIIFIVTSDDVELICKKNDNNTTFHKLLEPYSKVNNRFNGVRIGGDAASVETETSSNEVYLKFTSSRGDSSQSFCRPKNSKKDDMKWLLERFEQMKVSDQQSVREFQNFYRFCQTQKLDSNNFDNRVNLMCGESQDAAYLSGLLRSHDPKSSDATNDFLMPWFEDYKTNCFASVKMCRWESFKYPMACVLAVSSGDVDTLSTMDELFNKNASYIQSIWSSHANNTLLTFHRVLVHDESGPIAKSAAISKYQTLLNIYPANSCSLVTLNSQTLNSDNQILISLRDIHSIKKFLQTLVYNNLMPTLLLRNKKNYTPSKNHKSKSISKILNSMVSPKSSSEKNKIADLFKPDSRQFREKLLADWNFAMGNYRIAAESYSNYLLFCNSEQPSKNHDIHRASSMEMLAHCHSLVPESKLKDKKVSKLYFTAFSLYWDANLIPWAHRTALAYLSWSFYNSYDSQVSQVLDKLLSCDSVHDSHKSTLLQQKTLSHILCSNPLIRHYAYDLTATAVNFIHNGEFKLALQSLLLSQHVYDARQRSSNQCWRPIQLYIKFHVALVAAHIGLLDFAKDCIQQLVQDQHTDPSLHAVIYSQFLAINSNQFTLRRLDIQNILFKYDSKFLLSKQQITRCSFPQTLPSFESVHSKSYPDQFKNLHRTKSQNFNSYITNRPVLRSTYSCHSLCSPCWNRNQTERIVQCTLPRIVGSAQIVINYAMDSTWKRLELGVQEMVTPFEKRYLWRFEKTNLTVDIVKTCYLGETIEVQVVLHNHLNMNFTCKNMKLSCYYENVEKSTGNNYYNSHCYCKTRESLTFAAREKKCLRFSIVPLMRGRLVIKGLVYHAKLGIQIENKFETDLLVDVKEASSKIAVNFLNFPTTLVEGQLISTAMRIENVGYRPMARLSFVVDKQNCILKNNSQSANRGNVEYVLHPDKSVVSTDGFTVNMKRPLAPGECIILPFHFRAQGASGEVRFVFCYESTYDTSSNKQRLQRHMLKFNLCSLLNISHEICHDEQDIRKYLWICGLDLKNMEITSGTHVSSCVLKKIFFKSANWKLELKNYDCGSNPKLTFWINAGSTTEYKPYELNWDILFAANASNTHRTDKRNIRKDSALDESIILDYYQIDVENKNLAQGDTDSLVWRTNAGNTIYVCLVFDVVLSSGVHCLCSHHIQKLQWLPSTPWNNPNLVALPLMLNIKCPRVVYAEVGKDNLSSALVDVKVELLNKSPFDDLDWKFTAVNFTTSQLSKNLYASQQMCSSTKFSPSLPFASYSTQQVNTPDSAKKSKTHLKIKKPHYQPNTKKIRKNFKSFINRIAQTNEVGPPQELSVSTASNKNVDTVKHQITISNAPQLTDYIWIGKTLQQGTLAPNEFTTFNLKIYFCRPGTFELSNWCLYLHPTDKPLLSKRLFNNRNRVVQIIRNDLR